MTVTQEATTHVERLVAGLREFADFVEAHPQFEFAIRHTAFLLPCTFDIDEFPRYVREMGGTRHKDVTDKYFAVSRFFGGEDGIELRVYAQRDLVCEQVQTGTRTVEVEEIVTPAITKTVTVEAPVFEWECKSILAEIDA